MPATGWAHYPKLMTIKNKNVFKDVFLLLTASVQKYHRKSLINSHVVLYVFSRNGKTKQLRDKKGLWNANMVLIGR